MPSLLTTTSSNSASCGPAVFQDPTTTAKFTHASSTLRTSILAPPTTYIASQILPPSTLERVKLITLIANPTTFLQARAAGSEDLAIIKAACPLEFLGLEDCFGKETLQMYDANNKGQKEGGRGGKGRASNAVRTSQDADVDVDVDVDAGVNGEIDPATGRNMLVRPRAQAERRDEIVAIEKLGGETIAFVGPIHNHGSVGACRQSGGGFGETYVKVSPPAKASKRKRFVGFLVGG